MRRRAPHAPARILGSGHRSDVESRIRPTSRTTKMVSGSRRSAMSAQVASEDREIAEWFVCYSSSRNARTGGTISG
jgi:hypothetical protein